MDTTVYIRIITPSNNRLLYGFVGASNPSISNTVSTFINGQTVNPFELVISSKNYNFGRITNATQLTQYTTITISMTYFLEPVIIKMPLGYEVSTDVDIMVIL
ncbi:MAG: hypothetical protein HC905_03700 [Bacteroidales bacterium]|nr:hypothetical protein [Bacteroidales bacterium]